MKTYRNKHSGFTLIEMVAVIIILAIMAATALPRFINLSSDARFSSVQGLAGGLRSAAALAKAQWLVNQSGTATTVSMATTLVTVWNGVNANPSSIIGFPVADNTGIVLALDNTSGYMSAADGGGGGYRWAVWPSGVATSSTCAAIYESGSVIVTANKAADCI